MAWTQADIDTLKLAVASGVKKVVFEGPPKREIEYQSLSEMRGLLAEMRAEVNSVSQYTRAKHRRGYRD